MKQKTDTELKSLKRRIFQRSMLAALSVLLMNSGILVVGFVGVVVGAFVLLWMAKDWRREMKYIFTGK